MPPVQVLCSAGTEVPSKGAVKHCTLASAEAAVPPRLVPGCSQTCQTVLSNTDSKSPGSIPPRATSVAGAAASVTANPSPPPAKGGMLPLAGEPLPSEKRGSAFLGKAEPLVGWLGKKTVGSEPQAVPFYTAHSAPGFLHQHQVEQELTSSPQGKWLLQA